MKIEDFGFITSIKKYEENSLLVKVLSKENGLISGYLMHIKKDRTNYQIGNLVKFVWSAKSTNQLGILKIELVKSYLSYFIENRFYLHLMDCITSLINSLLYERYLEDTLFQIVESIFDLVVHNEEKYKIVKEYLYFENTLLNIIGTGIIFENNKSIDDLYYISPKTGLAVDKKKGEPYRDRLLIFPAIFKKEKLDRVDIFECFYIMDFFLKKYLEDNNYSYKYKALVLLRENILNNI